VGLLHGGPPMRIRQEREDEFLKIRELVKTAFQTANVSEGDEHDFVERLRRGPDYLGELALVVEDHAELIAHIMLTQTFVATSAARHPVLLLAIVSVALERRKQGIGAQLIQEAFRRAKGKNHSAIVLLGDPVYYSRFGFKPSIGFGISNTNQIDDRFVMVCELIPEGLRDVHGTVSLPA
jgi:predicted N-acetyltransferase YhbS